MAYLTLSPTSTYSALVADTVVHFCVLLDQLAAFFLSIHVALDTERLSVAFLAKSAVARTKRSKTDHLLEVSLKPFAP